MPLPSATFGHHRLRLAILAGGILLALLAFILVAEDVFHGPFETTNTPPVIDVSMAQFAAGFRSPSLTQVMTDFTALGSISVIATFYVLFFVILASFRDFRGLAYLTTVLAGAAIWPALLKRLFLRARPAQADWLVHVGDLSFPSGHSFGAAAAYVGFAYYAGLHARGWKQELAFFALGALLAVLVGCSRVYLGVHFSTDVLAGWSGGVAWGLACALAYELLVGGGVRRTRRARFAP